MAEIGWSMALSHLKVHATRPTTGIDADSARELSRTVRGHIECLETVVEVARTVVDPDSIVDPQEAPDGYHELRDALERLDDDG